MKSLKPNVVDYMTDVYKS